MKKQKNIVITQQDMNRLQELLSVADLFGYTGRDDLRGLEGELARARVISPQNVPADVITMHSRARLRDLNTGETVEYTLVFPKDADIETGCISILAPLGTAMLGYRVGDEFSWNVPYGLRQFKVEEVLYQPEAAGDFHL